MDAKDGRDEGLDRPSGFSGSHLNSKWCGSMPASGTSVTHVHLGPFRSSILAAAGVRNAATAAAMRVAVVNQHSPPKIQANQAK